MFNFKKGVVEFTTLMTLIMFLGTGAYNIYKLHTQVDTLSKQQENVIRLQDKYCNIDNPSYEQQRMCIEALKLNKTK